MIPMIHVVHGDAERFIEEFPGHAKLIFADPPDNIGLNYEGSSDHKEPKEYAEWLAKIIWLAIQKSDIFWLSYNAIHDQFINGLLGNMGKDFQKVIWRYTFSQYNDKHFASGYRPMVFWYKRGTKFFPEQVLTSSNRMEIGDKRAAGPRLPDNVWEFPRVVGNSWERCSWHPTQHPQDLLSRIIRYCCNVPAWRPFMELQKQRFTMYRLGEAEPSMKAFSCGSVPWSSDHVIDLFAGTGTSGRVCRKLRVPWTGVEASEFYVSKLVESLVPGSASPQGSASSPLDSASDAPE